MEGRIIVLVILALVLTEICLYINKIAGFVLYLLLIALYLLSLSQVKILNNYGKLIIILMIVPIVRVIELFITLEFFWKVVISYGVLLFLAFFYSVRFKLDHGHIKEKLGLFPFAVVVGVVLGFIGDAYFNFDKLFWLIYLIPFISYSEEILFRGMIQNLLEKNYGIVLSILISALLYGVFSLGYGVLFGVFVLLYGIIIGLIYHNSKNIFLAVTINIIIHYFIFVIA